MPMSRRKTWLALLSGAALGFALATSGGVLAARKPEVTDLPWQDARLMAEVIERVKRDYVDPVDDHELMQHAIRGMLSSLDAHSAFLDEDELEELRIASEGNYSGIGIEVSYEGGLIVVVAPIEGSPAERAGLRTGDLVVAIDGQEVFFISQTLLVHGHVFLYRKNPALSSNHHYIFFPYILIHDQVKLKQLLNFHQKTLVHRTEL